jgi:hypothetical protein
VEISRLPPFDSGQISAANTDSAVSLSPLSDLRTVTYQVNRQDESGIAAPNSLNTRGLVRGEAERTAYAWAIQEGKTGDLKQTQKVLVPEVDAIEFTYYDDTTSYTEWDSLQLNKLPTAVKIAIMFRPPDRKGSRSAAGQGGETPNQSMVYEKLVFLPNVRATADPPVSQAPKASTASSGASGSAGGEKQGGASGNSGVKQIQPINSTIKQITPIQGK